MVETTSSSCGIITVEDGDWTEFLHPIIDTRQIGTRVCQPWQKALKHGAERGPRRLAGGLEDEDPLEPLTC